MNAYQKSAQKLQEAKSALLDAGKSLDQAHDRYHAWKVFGLAHAIDELIGILSDPEETPEILEGSE